MDKPEIKIREIILRPDGKPTLVLDMLTHNMVGEVREYYSPLHIPLEVWQEVNQQIEEIFREI